MTTIEFDGLIFDDAATSGLTISKLTGWWDGPGVRLNLNDRPQAHGSFGVAKAWRTARTVTVEGTCVGLSMADTYAMIDRLAALQASGMPGVFRVNEPFGSKQIVANLALAPQMPDQLFSPFFTFSFAVTSPDSFKYGLPAAISTGVPVAAGGLIYPLGSGSAYWDYGTGGASGRIALTNIGTAPVFPPFEVTGGLDGVVVTDVTTNQVVRLDRQIPAGSTAFFNQRTGRAYLDNVSSDISPFISSRGWFQIGPGETHQIQFQPLGAVVGSPTLTVRMSPAYL